MQNGVCFQGNIGILDKLRQRLVGQDEAIREVADCVELFRSGIYPEGRPLGVFLLLGPTGTGKTKTVEALADALHGSERNVLRIDCGEFQLEHEVARLIGAPPGYVGHRETQPIINQSKLNAVASDKSAISLVLFDEIEKAAPSLGRLLLGVLDKATLKLSDNTTVNFERSMIFMTSNLGAREMMAELAPAFGFAGQGPGDGSVEKLKRIGTAAVRKRFSPEFVNRVDQVLTYKPLDRAALESILDLQLGALQEHIVMRLGPAGFQLHLSEAARAMLLEEGTCRQYGARELKRTIHRRLVQPLARMITGNMAPRGRKLYVSVVDGSFEFSCGGLA